MFLDDYPEYKILRLSESLELTCKLDEVESIGWFHDNIKQDLNGVNRFTISTTKVTKFKLVKQKYCFQNTSF